MAARRSPIRSPTAFPAFPNSVLGIIEDDKWYSFRLGVNGVVTVWDRLKLTADAA